jgi:dienelactone hydrolase
MKRILLASVLLLSIVCYAQTVTLEKASTHPMRYYLSLPEGWNGGQTWPVVIAIEAAEKDFKGNAERFARARGKSPYIIVVPVSTTNGNQGVRDPSVYPYSTEEWDRVDRETNCRFDDEGLMAVLTDLRKRYNAAEKYYLTGFEAGTHLLWSLVFKHPEHLLAAAPVAGNYIGRCVDEKAISSHAARVQLPIRNFTGAGDEYFGINGKVYSQYQKAHGIALMHGYKNFSEQDFAGKGHEPLPAEVLAWFDSLRNAARR